MSGTVDPRPGPAGRSPSSPGRAAAWGPGWLPASPPPASAWASPPAPSRARRRAPRRSPPPSTSPTPAPSTGSAAVVDRLGRIDLWVNNAGVLDPIGPLRESPRLWPPTSRSTSSGSCTAPPPSPATCAAAPAVACSSTSAAARRRPYEGWAAYCAAKAAVDQLTQVVAAEEAGAGPGARWLPGWWTPTCRKRIRSADKAAFPRVERFRDLARDGGVQQPGLGGGPDPPAAGRGPGTVVLRIPDEPRA